MTCARCGRFTCRCREIDVVAHAMERFPYQRPPRVADHLRREASAFMDRLEISGATIVLEDRGDGPTEQAQP